MFLCGPVCFVFLRHANIKNEINFVLTVPLKASDLSEPFTKSLPSLPACTVCAALALDRCALL